jgi:hypothetical protein
MPEHLGFIIWNQISEKLSNFEEIAIHKKTGQFKIRSILVNPCIKMKNSDFFVNW